MKKFVKFFGLFVVIIAIGFWWLLIQGKAPKTSSEEFDLATYRQLATADDATSRPQSVHIEITGSEETPGFAADSGNFKLKYTSVYSAFQIVYPEKTIVIGGAVDKATSEDMTRTDTAFFDPAAYARLLQATSQAEQVWITHEHLDHVMAIARHPRADTLASNLKLNPDQLATLPEFALGGKLAPSLASIDPQTFTQPTLVAPGIVVDRTPGHTPGSQTIYVQLENGTEYLFVGDIIWNMVNLDTLRTRPRLIQYLFFEPNEDRKAVLRQIRELHDMRAANPTLIIVPSHHGEYIETLVANGDLIPQFRLED